MENSPVNLARIAIGNGALVSMEIFTELPVVTVLETYPQIIGYDTQVMEYFREQYVQTSGMYVIRVLIFHLGVHSVGTTSRCNTLKPRTFRR